MTHLLLALCLLLPQAFAHEGHDHDAPSAVQAPKGGEIKDLENTFVEVVAKKKDLRIYLYDRSLKARDLTGFTVTASALRPRAKAAEPIALHARPGFYEGSYDAKGSHRYELAIQIFDPSTKHTDLLKFNIEPRK